MCIELFISFTVRRIFAYDMYVHLLWCHFGVINVAVVCCNYYL